MDIDNSKIASLFNKNWKLLGIVYYGRSGSFFLQSILDGHPQIIALPPHINNMYKLSFDSTKNFYRKTFVTSVINKIFMPLISECIWSEIHENPIPSSPSKFFGENKDIIFNYDYCNFITIFNKVISIASQNSLTISRKNIYLSFFFAYNLMIGKDIDALLNAKYLLCQLHTPVYEELAAVKEDFNDLVYLVSIREPVSGLISHIQAYNSMLEINFFNEGSYNHCIPLAINEVLNGAVVYDFLDKEKCRAVKNEYLHIYGDQYVKCLLEYLDLPWSDMCKKSTVDGEIFWWKFGDKYTTGYNKNYKWKICDKANASCSDKMFFSTLLKDRYEAWNYQCCPNTTLNIRKKIKEGFDFFECLNLSALTQKTFLHHILQYYEKCYGQHKEYIPALDFSPHEIKQHLNCGLLQPNDCSKC